jgi:hypothetical protein
MEVHYNKFVISTHFFSSHFIRALGAARCCFSPFRRVSINGEPLLAAAPTPPCRSPLLDGSSWARRSALLTHWQKKWTLELLSNGYITVSYETVECLFIIFFSPFKQT